MSWMHALPDCCRPPVHGRVELPCATCAAPEVAGPV